MKKFVIILLIGTIVSLSVSAQKEFEGTIKFSWKIVGEGSDMIDAMMPSASYYLVRNKDVLFKMEGGMMTAMIGDILYLNKSKLSYMIRKGEKIAYKIEQEVTTDKNVKPTVIKVDEILKILGYDCQKYKVITKSGGVETVQYIWTTNAFKFPGMVKNKATRNSNLKIEGVDGLPLKLITSAGPMNIIMTATLMNKSVPDKSNFVLPKDYEIKIFDASKIMGF